MGGLLDLSTHCLCSCSLQALRSFQISFSLPLKHFAGGGEKVSFTDWRNHSWNGFLPGWKGITLAKTGPVKTCPSWGISTSVLHAHTRFSLEKRGPGYWCLLPEFRKEIGTKHGIKKT